MEAQLQSIAAAATVRARAELFKDFLAGGSAKWDQKEMQEEVDAYEEELKLEAEGAEETDDPVDKFPFDIDNLANADPSTAAIDPPASTSNAAIDPPES